MHVDWMNGTGQSRREITSMTYVDRSKISTYSTHFSFWIHKLRMLSQSFSLLLLLTICISSVRNICCICNISIANVNIQHALKDMPPKYHSIPVRLFNVSLHLCWIILHINVICIRKNHTFSMTDRMMNK